MESPELTGKGHFPALPYLWAPLLVLTAGLMVTGITSLALENQARSLAEEVYHRQHDTLVAQLNGYEQLPPAIIDQPVPEEPLNDSASVGLWLATVFKNSVPGVLNLRIDTLERHTKTPLFQTINTANPDRSRSLRTEISIGEHRWLLTTLPDTRFLERPAQQSFRFVWLAGLVITLLATVIAVLLCLRLRRWQAQFRKAEDEREEYRQQLNNMQVEKSILRRALNDSEQRSRDLVALSGTTICELDEAATAAYISPQVADLLQRDPADLSGQPFEELVVPDYLGKFHRTLEAARQEQQIQRIDLKLLDANGQRVPVTVRVLALRDTLYGFSGYRLSLQPGIQTMQ